MTFSEWAAPIVPVVKRDGNVRICGDYKLIVNTVLKTDPYPLPRIEDIFASLSGGKTFTKLDLEHAYQQVPLTEAAQKYTTVNTHKGLFQYKRRLLEFFKEPWRPYYRTSLMYVYTLMTF